LANFTAVFGRGVFGEGWAANQDNISRRIVMWSRMSNGWALARESWGVLRQDKQLLLFPLLSGIACLLVLLSFAVPLWASGFAEKVLAAEEGERNLAMEIVGYGLLFAFYFVNYFVIVFFNSALVSCAVIRFKGGHPTLADGLSAAMERLPQIAGWAALAATVGVILKLIESRSQRLGQIVASLLGMAWTIVTYFVVPVIVVEQASPIRAMKRSASVMKNTWGESLVANFGIGVIVFLANLLAIVPIVAGIVALLSEQVALGIFAIAVGLFGILIISLVSSALNAIIITALYLYAAEGKVPGQFRDELFQQAFAQK
jgi:hypothetical protein